ncbi:MAG: hypothetical protein ACFE8E_07930 [Candidatus Hodarchaeota archaeon]
MLNLFGWIDGITASGVVIFGIVIGIFFIYKAKKTNARILNFLGLANLFAGLMYLGVFLDFLYVLPTETNIDNTSGIVGILSYIWLAPAIITSIYIGAELQIPKLKWYIVILFVILSISFEIIIFIDPISAFNFDDPPDPAELLIDYNVKIFSIAGILMAVFLLSIIVLLGIGFLVKAFQSSGILRKKFLLLSLGSIFFCVFGLLEGLTEPGYTLIFVRIGYLSSFWFMYYGLKT